MRAASGPRAGSGRPVQPAAAGQKTRVLVFTFREDRPAWGGEGAGLFLSLFAFSLFQRIILLLLLLLLSLREDRMQLQHRPGCVLCGTLRCSSGAPSAYLALVTIGSAAPWVHCLFVRVVPSFGSCRSSPRRRPSLLTAALTPTAVCFFCALLVRAACFALPPVRLPLARRQTR